MLIHPVVPALCLLAAVVIWMNRTRSPRLADLLGIVTPLLCLGLGWLGLSWLGADRTAGRPDSGWLQTDSVTKMVLILAPIAALVMNALRPAPFIVAALLWNSGLLCLMSTCGHPVWWWGALQLTLLPLLLHPARGSFISQQGWHRDPYVVGSGLLALGMLLLCLARVNIVTSTLSMVLILSGMGGLLGWFPFPRILLQGEQTSSVDAFALRTLPLMTGGVLLLRLATLPTVSAEQLGLIALVSLFSAVASAARLLWEDRLSSRIVLTSTCLLSSLAWAGCLCGWETLHPARAWPQSNLPHAQTLFLAILNCEVAALLVLVSCSRVLTARGHEGDYAQTLEGALSAAPVAAVSLLCGVISLAGLPPLPGFWWRSGLIAALLLPHNQSNVTGLIEPNDSFAFLAFAFVLLWILSCLGQLRLLQQVLFASPFRVRTEPSNWRTNLAGGFALLLLGVSTAYPLTLAAQLFLGKMNLLAR
ncbi:hypothetical protein [Planctomicrobium sp. SH664]|uniref:hypothetical protein n=1 Tax=Planctomicrobium sp. SH664 TaxID=3448125 RepID=UPI003F5C6EB4